MTFPRYITPIILGTATVAVVVQSQVVLAQTKTADEIRTIAQGITVRIDGPGKAGNNGSGIIIERQGNTYTVLTCGHVVDEAGQYTIQTTSDNQRYTVNYSQIQQPDKNIDLAVIQFTSNKTYPVAKQGNYKQLKNGMTLYAAGWYNPGAVVKERVFDVPKGRFVSQVTPTNGYALAYQLELAQPGMSGGPLLNEQGEVIAVNGFGKIDLRTNKIDLIQGVPVETLATIRSNPTPLDTSPTAEVERLISLGCAKISQNDPQAAIDAFTKAINLDPQNAEAYNNRGNAYRNLKDYDRAIADYNQAIKLDPNFASAYNSRGYAHRNLKDYDRAIADYNQAIKLDPNFTYAYYNRGSTYCYLENYNRAIADLNQAIKLDPNYAKAYNNRGYAYLGLKDYNRAIADFNQVIKLDPNYVEAYNNRGDAYYYLKDYNRAIADYNQAIKLDPNDAAPYNNRGYAYLTLKDYNRAIADYNQAIKLDPNLAFAYNNRGLAYLNLKNYNRAIADYNQAIKLDPNNATVYSNRGWAYELLGNRNKAREDFQQAARIFKAQNDNESYQRVLEILRQLK